MTALETVSSIKHELTRLDTLAAAVRLFRFLTKHRGQRRGVKEARSQWTNIRQLLADDREPAHTRLQEALNAEYDSPSEAWIEWFSGLVANNDCHKPEIDILSDGLDLALDKMTQFMTQLPRKFWQDLAPEFQPQAEPWVIRIRPRPGAEIGHFPERITCQINLSVDPPRDEIRCARYWQFKDVLGRNEWIVSWPKVRSLKLDIQRVATKLRQQGVCDLHPTIDDIILAILARIDSVTPEWLGGEPLPENIQEQLLAGALEPPRPLTRIGLENFIREHFRPCELSSLQIEPVFPKLFEDRLVCRREVQYTPATGGAVQVANLIIGNREAVEPPPQTVDAAEDRAPRTSDIDVDLESKEEGAMALLIEAYPNCAKTNDIVRALSRKVVDKAIQFHEVPPTFRALMSGLRSKLNKSNFEYTIKNERSKGYRLVRKPNEGNPP